MRKKSDFTPETMKRLTSAGYTCQNLQVWNHFAQKHNRAQPHG